MRGRVLNLFQAHALLHKNGLPSDTLKHAPGATAQVEYRVTRNLSLVSKVNDQIVTQAGQVIQGGDELSVRWRHDFHDKNKAPGPPPARREPSRPLPAQPQR